MTGKRLTAGELVLGGAWVGGRIRLAVHVPGVGEAFRTLCGLREYAVEGTAASLPEADRRVNCPQCLAIVAHVQALAPQFLGEPLQ